MQRHVRFFAQSAHRNVRMFYASVADKAPSQQAVRRLQRMLAKRERAQAQVRACDDEIAKAVVELRAAEGVTVRALADALRVGASTVQDWTRRGRQLGGS